LFQICCADSAPSPACKPFFAHGAKANGALTINGALTVNSALTVKQNFP
jgi:hypothetical protein